MADLSELAGLYSSRFEKVNLYHLLVFPDKWALKRVCKQQQSPGLLAEPLVSKGLSRLSVTRLSRAEADVGGKSMAKPCSCPSHAPAPKQRFISKTKFAQTF